MRTLLAVASIALLVGAGFGCGDDTTTSTMNDMTMPLDMTASVGDMAKIPTCAAVLSCITGCQGNATCSLNCQTNQSAAAAQYWTPFASCLYGSCAMVDGGSNMCPFPPTTNPDAACQQCLASAFVASTQAGGACNSQYTACTAH